MSYFVCVEKNQNEKVYGPFATEREAMLKNIFYRSEAELTSAQNARTRIETYAAVGVSSYSSEELKAIAEDPQAYKLKSFKVLPASALKNHSDWDNSDLTFLANYWLGEV